MPDHLMPVNGTRLHVTERGPADAPALLYLHGGPGHSSYTFDHFQADHLADHGIHVITLDQRGILRSDPLPEHDTPTVDQIITDAETVRDTLHIPTWTVLGHSAGGHYALRYALAHPDTVTALALDCPALDADLTDRHRLPIAAKLLDDMGEHDAAAECRALAARPDRLTAADAAYKPMLNAGKRYNELFFASQAHIDACDAAENAAGFPGDMWARGGTHLPLLADMYDSLIPRLPELTRPSMLLHGRHDLVAAPAVVDAYRAHAPGGRVHTFENSSHFAYLEEPDAYARVVADFVKGP